ncbi:glycoside hydrolase family 2 [Paenibacillus sp. 598K]|uniref:glycoside hydrolase family 2 protein n=1 Tax=Paenibacillus sp. 598K TaxID=1117987 RepID=UPI000FF970E6|nr:glycoside hydrolase family 2 [Paenibacillus sp. 598K]GBF75699.1 glycoside hydrolase family 2 [Paenibacillus sp. 598K]
MNRWSLNGEWELYYVPQKDSELSHPAQLAGSGARRLTARVPGNVELDMHEAGLIDDPYTGDTVKKLEIYELYEWWYVREFDTPQEPGSKQLVFHGVDCIATYWLNGVELGRSDNMLIAHTFEVDGLLSKDGPNRLAVRLQSPIYEAMRYDYDPSMWAMDYNWSQLWIRKAAHGFGWDIMPRAVSAGLWREVELIVRDDVEIMTPYIYTKRLEGTAALIGMQYNLKADPAWFREMTLRLVGVCGDSRFEHRCSVNFSSGHIDLRIDDARLWWPRGYGEAHLYELHTELLHGDTVIAARSDTFGVRTVELLHSAVTSTDEGGEFLFKVNDEPIFCKGSNWVPADMYHSRDKSRIPRMLDLFAEMNCNIVRIWGGGVYEDHDFFERCDREGLMVWQDFAFACALYPQTELFYEKVRQEARFIVRKLRNHPSLILWCGDNEIDMFSFHRQIDPGLNRISREVLPAIVAQCDPHRAYLASSPYVSEEVWRRRNLALLPEDHLWGPRDYYKSSYYTASQMHFVSEIGYHGCPSVESIERFIAPEHRWPWQHNEQWALHGSDPMALGGCWSYRTELMANQIKEVFGEIPDTLDDFAIASQISQAEAKKFFVEMVRLRKWRRTGIVWWNMIDGWPQFSDAVVDYYFDKKLAFHYLQRVHQDVCIMIDEPSDWHVRAVVSNDTLADRAGSYRIRDADSGETLLEGEFVAAANGNADLGRVRVSHSEQRMFLIEWTIDGETYHNHYLLGFPGFSLERYKGWMKQLTLPEGAAGRRREAHGGSESEAGVEAIQEKRPVVGQGN